MYSDKKRVLALSLTLIAVLLSCFFLNFKNMDLLVACILVVYATLTLFYVKKRGILSIYRPEVLIIISVVALLYLVLYYLMGLKFGYYSSSINFLKVLSSLLIIGVTAVSSEFLKVVYSHQNVKGIGAIIFIACVIADILPQFNSSVFTSFNSFMDFLGLNLFPSITFNVLFYYLASRYGIWPGVSYKLITEFLPVVISVTPFIPPSLLSFIQLLLPLLILAFIKMLYEKKVRPKKKVGRVVSITLVTLMISFMIFVMAVISCQFSICALVIATESMTGEINKGDMIVYERFDDQVITEGQIIVFDKDGLTTVHRVVKIEIVNGVYRYVTKGDANENEDNGYITNNDIEGVVHFKLAYLGYPTLWIRQIFK